MPGVKHMVPKLRKWALNLRSEPEGPLHEAQAVPFSDVEYELGGVTSEEAEPGLEWASGLLLLVFAPPCASLAEGGGKLKRGGAGNSDP